MRRIFLFIAVILIAVGVPLLWGQILYLNRTPGSADTLPQMTDKLNWDLAYLDGKVAGLSGLGGNTYITNLYSSNTFITNLYVLTNYSDYVTVTNGITNLSLTANTVLKADANKRITSIANSGGALTNNGAGVFGWFNGFATLADLTTVSNSFSTNLWVNNLYASNAYADNITITNGITNLSLTASTVLKSDANKRIASIANGTGALTNNGAGVFGWYTYASGSDILTYSNNVNTLINSTSNSILSQMTNSINTTSNAILSQMTNTVNNTSNAILSQVGGDILAYSNTVNTAINTVSNNVISQVSSNNTFTQVLYNTNACTMAPDFAKGYCWISTNAAFAFLAPLNLDYTKAQTTVMIVTNSSGSAILATAPANVHVVPGSTMYITNATAYTWFHYPLVGTNVYAVPMF